MIKPETYYECICDFCGEKLCLDEITAWRDESEAEDGWITAVGRPSVTGKFAVIRALIQMP